MREIYGVSVYWGIDNGRGEMEMVSGDFCGFSYDFFVACMGYIGTYRRFWGKFCVEVGRKVCWRVIFENVK